MTELPFHQLNTKITTGLYPPSNSLLIHYTQLPTFLKMHFLSITNLLNFLQNIKSLLRCVLGIAILFKLHKISELLCSNERHSSFSLHLLAHPCLVNGSLLPKLDPHPGKSPSFNSYPAGQASLIQFKENIPFMNRFYTYIIALYNRLDISKIYMVPVLTDDSISDEMLFSNLSFSCSSS